MREPREGARVLTANDLVVLRLRCHVEHGTMSPTWLTELHALLEAPDPSDLVGRGHRVRFAGDPRRRQTVLLPLLTRWAVTRQVQNDPPPRLGPARKGFRLLVSERRRAAGR